MSTLTVVGGFYLERCIQPLWNEIFGSGGRAAAAVSDLGTKVEFHTYVSDEFVRSAEGFAEQYGIVMHRNSSDRMISFDYLHPLSTPAIRPRVGTMQVLPPIMVKAPVVLRYGMLEGDAVVEADVAIYDPQSAFGATGFRANGSKAKRLAIVLNQQEAYSITGQRNPDQAIDWLLQNEQADVVVLKMGMRGAIVATPALRKTVSVYAAERVWKVGSGDVYSASFALFWAIRGMDPVVAADMASKATACYCASRRLPILDQDALTAAAIKPVSVGTGLVYLAGPFFDLGQRWLVEEAKAKLEQMGLEVFSPVHEVGPGPAEVIAPADIAGLEKSEVVFAILNGLDTGTIFEVGYAVKMGIPVIGLAQNLKEEDLKMIEGTGCQITDDFCTAIYKTGWSLGS